MSKLENPILMAVIGAAQGLRGEVRVKTFTEDPLGLGDYGFLFAADGRKFEILEIRDGKTVAIVRFRGINDRNAAEALRGARIFVPRSSFPTAGDGEYYWVDLIGLQVLNREGVDLGQVRDLMSTGPQTVLVIEAAPEAEGGKPVERMIPFVAAFVDGVDLPGKRITVDWQPDY